MMNKRCRGIILFLITLIMTACVNILCSAEILHADMSFPGTGSNLIYTVDTVFDEDWFAQDNTVFNRGLATTTLSMAMASFDMGKTVPDHKDINIESFLTQLGFSHYEAMDYDKPHSPYTIATAIASRQMQDSEGPYTLIAVAICGQGYGNEWVSNFTVNDGQEHAGFQYAADMVVERLSNYRSQYAAEGRVKIWTGGFSRAAAVSNFTAAVLLQKKLIPEDCVYAYCFATPNNTRGPVEYKQIFNICNSLDVVPKMPLSVWGYSKFGQVLFLPSRENTMDYDRLAQRAQAAFLDIGLPKERFGSSSDRDWFLSKIVDMLAKYLPNVSDYTDGVQQAISVAWMTDGSAGDKLRSMFEVLERYSNGEESTDISNQFVSELTQIISRGAIDSMGEMTGSTTGTNWLNLLTSGTYIAYEHYPQVYLSWLRSDLTDEELFEHDSRFLQISWTGDMDAQIISILDEDNTSIWLDTTTGQGPSSTVRLGNQTYVNLPIGQEYMFIFKVPQDTLCQISWELEDPSIQYDTSIRTAAFHVYKGENLFMNIPLVIQSEDDLCVIQSNGEIVMVDADSQLVSAGVTQNTKLKTTLSGLIIMAPYLLLSMVLLIYALTVGILRLIHGSSLADRVDITLCGKIMLIVSAVLCCLAILRFSSQLVMTLSNRSNLDLQNRTFLRLSEYMGWGLEAYCISGIIMYAVTIMLCLMSIRHGMQRVRLARLCVMLLILDMLEIFLSLEIMTFRFATLLMLLIPVFIMIALRVARDRNDISRLRTKCWQPIRIALALMLLLFVARQMTLLSNGDWSYSLQNIRIQKGDASQTIHVVLKCLTGLPALWISWYIYKKQQNRQHLLTFIAIFLCGCADTLININTYVGMGLFVAGHIVLIVMFRKTPMPSVMECVSWLVLSAAAIAFIQFIQPALPSGMRVPAIAYAIISTFMLVSSFRSSKRLITASVLLVVTDYLVALKIAYPGNILMESAQLLIYYLSILMIAADGHALIPENLLPSYVKKDKQQEKNGTSAEA